MNYFRNNNWLIGILILSNIITLFLLFRPAPTVERGHRAPHAFKKHLNLDDSQAKAFHQAIEQHRTISRPIFRQMRENKRIMIDLLEVPEPDTIAAQALASVIGQQQEELDRLLIRHYLRLQAICTPEQQKELHRSFLRTFQRRSSRGQR